MSKTHSHYNIVLNPNRKVAVQRFRRGDISADSITVDANTDVALSNPNTAYGRSSGC
jgi:hypothetical protein